MTLSRLGGALALLTGIGSFITVRIGASGPWQNRSNYAFRDVRVLYDEIAVLPTLWALVLVAAGSILLAGSRQFSGAARLAIGLVAPQLVAWAIYSRVHSNSFHAGGVPHVRARELALAMAFGCLLTFAVVAIDMVRRDELKALRPSANRFIAVAVLIGMAATAYLGERWGRAGSGRWGRAEAEAGIYLSAIALFVVPATVFAVLSSDTPAIRRTLIGLGLLIASSPLVTLLFDEFVNDRWRSDKVPYTLIVVLGTVPFWRLLDERGS